MLAEFISNYVEYDATKMINEKRIALSWLHMPIVLLLL